MGTSINRRERRKLAKMERRAAQTAFDKVRGTPDEGQFVTRNLLAATIEGLRQHFGPESDAIVIITKRNPQTVDDRLPSFYASSSSRVDALATLGAFVAKEMARKDAP